MDLLGRVLATRYRLDRKIGTGGSARVYAARDLVLERDVAVKVLHPALAADTRFLRRFQAEARSAAGLQHHGVVSVHDFGIDEGLAYMVLELVDGGSLQDLLDGDVTLEPGQAARLGADVCSVLEYAHERGVVHRDVKPGNVLLSADGRAKVADFGLARALAEASWTEPLNTVMGTARYAPPEVLEGEPPSPRGDLYSLGLVLAEAVTGQPVFTAETTVGVLAGRLRGTPALPAGLGPLADVVSRATAADPADRYPDASAMRADLVPLASGPAVIPARRTAEPSPTGPVRGVPGVRGEPGMRGEPDDPTRETRPLPRVAAALPPSHRRRRLRHLVGRWLRPALLGLGAAVVVVGLSSLWVYVVAAHTVLDVHGLDVAAARQRLANDGVRVAVAAAAPDYVIPEGKVVRTQPDTGGKVRWRGTVNLVPSSGPPRVTVPEIEKLSLPDAARTLYDAGLRPGAVSVQTSPAPSLSVIGFERGSIPAGSAVAITVSAGPPAAEVPDVTGVAAAEAEARLRATGFSADPTEEFSDDVKAGDVIRQQPAPGARVRGGRAVALVVSKGPDLVDVPDVRGQPVASALSRLEAAGLKPVVSALVGEEFVAKTDPDRGATVRRGSRVVVFTI